MRNQIILIQLGGFAVGAWALPGDSLVVVPDTDSSRLAVSGDRELGRSFLRHRLEWLRQGDGWTFSLRDTSLFRLSGEPGAWSGESFLDAGWRRPPDSGFGFGASWKLWNRADGLGAPHASLAENAWRQLAVVRGTVGDSSWAAAASLGALAEQADPGAASQGIRYGEAPSSSLHAAGFWSLEGSWSGFESAPARVDASWSDLAGGSVLRQARVLFDGSIEASLAGEGRDTARLEAWFDSTRNRSVHFLSDRADARRGARVAWVFPAGRQRLRVAAGWQRVVADDFADRVPDLERTESNWEIEFGGALPNGWTHRNVFYRRDEERAWRSSRTGDPLVDALNAARDARDRDETGEFGLSDTLSWRTGRWGGVQVDLGLAQSLRSVRHPANAEPSTADRPDEDLSKRQWIVGLRSDFLAWGGRHFLSWTGLSQEDVFLRAVRSGESGERIENKLGLNLSLPVVDLARPQLRAWARELRDSWRFSPDRRVGLLEYGAQGGGEIGPADAPWLVAHWTRWRTRTGSLVGEDFAPDRIQDVWQPEARGFLGWGAAWTFEPWGRYQIERERSWSGIDWTESRYSIARAGTDLSWSGDRTAVRVSVARVWSDPGVDDWVGSFSARRAW